MEGMLPGSANSLEQEEVSSPTARSMVRQRSQTQLLHKQYSLKSMGAGQAETKQGPAPSTAASKSGSGSGSGYGAGNGLGSQVDFLEEAEEMLLRAESPAHTIVTTRSASPLAAAPAAAGEPGAKEAAAVVSAAGRATAQPAGATPKDGGAAVRAASRPASLKRKKLSISVGSPTHKRAVSPLALLATDDEHQDSFRTHLTISHKSIASKTGGLKSPHGKQAKHGRHPSIGGRKAGAVGPSPAATPRSEGRWWLERWQETAARQELVAKESEMATKQRKLAKSHGHGHYNGVWDLAMDDNRDVLYTASWDKTSRCFDAEDGQQLAIFAKHTEWVTCCCLSADGSTMYTGGYDAKIIKWDTETSECKGVFGSHSGPVTRLQAIMLAVARVGEVAAIASSSRDLTVRIWSTDTQQQLWCHTCLGPVTDLHFSDASRMLLVCSMDVNPSGTRNQVLMWRMSGRVVRRAADAPPKLLRQSSRARIQDTQGRKVDDVYLEVEATPHVFRDVTDRPQCAAAAMNMTAVFAAFAPSRIEVWHDVFADWEGSTVRRDSISTGATLAESPRTQWQRAASAAPVTYLHGHTGPVSQLLLVEDYFERAATLFSSSFDCTVRIWAFPNRNFRKGYCTMVLRGHTGAVTRMAYSLSGSLFSCSVDRSIRKWDKVIAFHPSTQAAAQWITMLRRSNKSKSCCPGALTRGGQTIVVRKVEAAEQSSHTVQRPASSRDLLQGKRLRHLVRQMDDDFADTGEQEEPGDGGDTPSTAVNSHTLIDLETGDAKQAEAEHTLDEHGTAPIIIVHSTLIPEEDPAGGAVLVQAERSGHGSSPVNDVTGLLLGELQAQHEQQSAAVAASSGAAAVHRPHDLDADADAGAGAGAVAGAGAGTDMKTSVWTASRAQADVAAAAGANAGSMVDVADVGGSAMFVTPDDTKAATGDGARASKQAGLGASRTMLGDIGMDANYDDHRAGIAAQLHAPDEVRTSSSTVRATLCVDSRPSRSSIASITSLDNSGHRVAPRVRRALDMEEHEHLLAVWSSSRKKTLIPAAPISWAEWFVHLIVLLVEFLQIYHFIMVANYSEADEGASASSGSVDWEIWSVLRLTKWAIGSTGRSTRMLAFWGTWAFMAGVLILAVACYNGFYAFLFTRSGTSKLWNNTRKLIEYFFYFSGVLACTGAANVVATVYFCEDGQYNLTIDCWDGVHWVYAILGPLLFMPYFVFCLRLVGVKGRLLHFGFHPVSWAEDSTSAVMIDTHSFAVRSASFARLFLATKVAMALMTGVLFTFPKTLSIVQTLLLLAASGATLGMRPMYRPPAQALRISLVLTLLAMSTYSGYMRFFLSACSEIPMTILVTMPAAWLFFMALHLAGARITVFS